MNGGVVTGGWGFVIAAYSVTGAVLLLYGVSLLMRLRAALRQAVDQSET